ncbi:polysaccharide pyruvyl transferase family protein [Citricoccus sp. GCM10030269]|uniref:glycosyltransferase family protein n=1 Tax=Citricoccus sp. GCM10030269 TaxID=3273388 RepID=UPI0036157EF2
MTESRTVNPTIERLRQELSTKVFDQGFHWRIMFLGKSINGTTDIVSSLHRSLKNLGHHVLEMDTSRHAVLDNPHCVMGGMGPIYVRYDRIRHMVDEFQPQMIILCAGGMVFTEEDAQLLKDRGIMLVGTTLSDPDVFPTVKDHIHTFDVHTTNSQTALQMYRDAGVTNTVYLPFGIDRGFVTQDVKTDPQFEHDVICLGHAHDRPDRNKVMTALDEHFDVKTYGRGWDLPDSEPVAGTEMVQALKGGKIHVNFPLTRAGFINIKCGVFESAGQGALVATGNFDEMADFFEYGEEIIGYDDEADLAEKIRQLLADPDEYDRIAENGFRRVITNHLYEHRWMDLFASFRELDEQTFPWLDAERRQTLTRTLSASLPRAKKVILSGFYGAGNLGDELILRSVSHALHRADPAVQVQVAAESATKVEAAHGLQAFLRRNLNAAAYEVHTAAAVVVGGGGLWHDYTFARAGGLQGLFTGSTISMAGFGILPLMGKVLDKPYHVVGMGVGPLTDEDARATVRFLAEQTSSLYVRDPESAELLRSLPVDAERITTGPDVVHAVPLPAAETVAPQVPAVIAEAKAAGRPVIGVNLRPWAHEDMGPVIETVAAALADAVPAEATARPLFVSVPMQAGESYDVGTVAQVFAQLPAGAETWTPEAPLDLETLAALYQSMDVLVAMRLHAALVAHRCGVPVVGLGYDPKVGRHFEEIGRGDWCLPLTVDRATLADRLRRGLESELPASTRDALDRLGEEASRALAVSAEMIAESPVPDAVYEVPAENAVGTGLPPETNTKPTRFVGLQPAGVGLSVPSGRPHGRFRASAFEIDLSLPVTKPEKGMELRWDGELHIEGEGVKDLGFTLSSPWSNPKATGRLFAEIEVAGKTFSLDLAQDHGTVLLHLVHEAGEALPFTFRLRVARSAFSASSWPKASATNLALVSVADTAAGLGPSLMASAGTVKDS